MLETPELTYDDVIELDLLAYKANDAHHKAEATAYSALEYAKEAGEYLAAAKALCKHGEWLPWLEANFEGSKRTAQAYMQVAAGWHEIEAKAQSSALLSVNQALQLLSYNGNGEDEPDPVEEANDARVHHLSDEEEPQEPEAEPISDTVLELVKAVARESKRQGLTPDAAHTARVLVETLNSGAVEGYDGEMVPAGTLIPVRAVESEYEAGKRQEGYKDEGRKSKRERILAEVAKGLPEVVSDFAPLLIEGDTLSELPKLGAGIADLLVIDPPYNVEKAHWDSYGSGAEYAAWAEGWLSECQRILKPTGALYLFGVNRMLSHLQGVLDALGMVQRNWIVWDTIQGSGGGLYVNRYESILYYSKSRETYEDAESIKLERHEENVREYRGKEYRFKSPSNVWRFPAVDAEHRDRVGHPTQKPVELLERIIKASSPAKGLVIDPFAGSGTALIAAMRHGRRSIGVEREPEYCELTRYRIAKEGAREMAR